MILLRPSMSRDTSIPCSGKSIGITVGFGDFGKVRRTKSAASSISPVALSTRAAFLPIVPTRGQDGRQHTFLVVAVDPVPQARREPAGDGQSWSLPPARIAAAEHDRS